MCETDGPHTLQEGSKRVILEVLGLESNKSKGQARLSKCAMLRRICFGSLCWEDYACLT